MTNRPEWTLGWRLRRSLEHAKISNDEMAARLGVSRQTVTRWTHDETPPRLAYLVLWSQQTGVDLEWLTPEMNPYPVAALERRKANRRTKPQVRRGSNNRGIPSPHPIRLLLPTRAA